MFPLTVACLVTFGFYVASYMRIPIVPLYAKSLGANTPMVGFINSAFFFTAGLLSFPLGLLADRLGRKSMATAGLLLLAATCFALVYTTTPVHIAIVYVFFGIGLATYGPTMMSYVADVAPATHLGRAYGWYTTALYTGMSVGPAVGTWVAGQRSYEEVFLASGILTLVLLFALALFLPGTLGLGAGTAPSQSPVGTRRDIRHNRALWACWLVTLGGCFGLGMFVTFIPLHAREAGVPITHIGLIFFAQGLSNALARVPFGHLSDRVPSRAYLVVAGVLATAVALAGFGPAANLWQFVLCAILLGAGMALAFTSIGALIAEAVPARSRGLAMGGY
ncbi:MAG: MFS transporter, partial [Bacteroidetes bacterium]